MKGEVIGALMAKQKPVLMEISTSFSDGNSVQLRLCSLAEIM
jgi:hypothetical protein